MAGMSDDEPPIPVIAEPLSYYDRANDPCLPTTRLLALAALVESGAAILSFLSRAGLSGWQAISPGSNRISYAPPWRMVVEVPAAIAATTLFVGALLALRLRRPGRQLIVVGAMAWAALTVLLAMVSAVFSMIQLGSRFGWPFTVTQMSDTFLFAVERCALPAVLWVWFRRDGVREMFETAGQ
jgi:hypothetical protein